MRLEIEQKVIGIVKQRHKLLFGEGVRKLCKSLKADFENVKLKACRDTLFNILKKYNMVTLRKKYNTRTTNSFHSFYKYKNICKDVKVTRTNQV